MRDGRALTIQSQGTFASRLDSASPSILVPYILTLFNNQDDVDPESDKTEGFWREFFLLKPDRASLLRILDDVGPDDLIQLQPQTRQLFLRAVTCLKTGNGTASLHALEVGRRRMPYNARHADSKPCDADPHHVFLRRPSQEVYQSQLGYHRSIGRTGSCRCHFHRFCQRAGQHYPQWGNTWVISRSASRHDG